MTKPKPAPPKVEEKKPETVVNEEPKPEAKPEEKANNGNNGGEKMDLE